MHHQISPKDHRCRRRERIGARLAPAADQANCCRAGVCNQLSPARRERDEWAATPEGALALRILLDQFPRNAFRGTARVSATDPVARHRARKAESAGHMAEVDVDLRLFSCLPFPLPIRRMPSSKNRSVVLNARPGRPWLSHAERQRDIIRWFGRFPHRNVMLGHRTTDKEPAFLDNAGVAG
ncbi:DUF924 family protein [Xanthomonas hyacinthi]|uniref:DUF924 domain-containing protein n=1 Tax=Xanthomonas hyacinthi TaxID=56455 RepID=A0A2S7EUM4_9XANT|nr:DUF924 domain-containing protein [Xanthomonas hyacinthi]QGY76196.1 DUF924 family protein [Xanthomonas hyacinthi]